jgi:hypothetical protein
MLKNVKYFVQDYMKQHIKSHTTYYRSYLNALPQEQSTRENHESHLAWQD